MSDPIEYGDRVQRLYRRGLCWQVCSELRVADDTDLLVRVEAMDDLELTNLNRASWREVPSE